MGMEMTLYLWLMILTRPLSTTARAIFALKLLTQHSYVLIGRFTLFRFCSWDPIVHWGACHRSWLPRPYTAIGMEGESTKSEKEKHMYIYIVECCLEWLSRLRKLGFKFTGRATYNCDAWRDMSVLGTSKF
jgi:hypothetical protein